MKRDWDTPSVECLDISSTAGGEVPTTRTDYVYVQVGNCRYWLFEECS